MKKAGLVILSIVAVLIVGSFSYIKYQEIAIEQEANSLNIPSSWKLISEQKAPAIPLCGDKSGCPSIVRTWELDRLYSKPELEQIFDSSRRKVKATRECTLPINSSMIDYIPACSADNFHSGYAYRYSIYEEGTVDGTDKYKVIMFLSRSRQ